MEIGKKLYVKDRNAWRAWLRKHHRDAGEIWLIYYKKNSPKPRIPYNDAVEEALCFGWIDSILKPIDGEKYAQRFSPRKKGSKLSAMNRERIRELVRRKKMTTFGLAAVKHVLDSSGDEDTVRIAPDILRALKADRKVWQHFQRFPDSYKRIRIGWIEAARERPEVLEQRLKYFCRMTAQNKKFGMVQ